MASKINSFLFFLSATWLILCCPAATEGQQVIQQGLYMLDPYVFNPAYGGLNNGLTITGNFRKQWNDLPGSPSSQYVTAHAPLMLLNSGIGGHFSHDALGASDITSASLSYNIILPTTIFISVGGGLGIQSKVLDGSILRTPDGNYENGVNHNDPNIPNGKSNSTNGIVNLGIVARTGLLEIGLSSLQTTKFGKQNKEQYYYQPSNHIMLYGSYFYTLNESWKIVPNALLKYDLKTLQSELDIHLYNKNLFGGVGIRGYNAASFDAVKVTLGGRITERIMVAYNFESPISSIRTYSGNTHELLLQYRIPTNFIQRPKEKMIYHPRM